MMFAQASSCLFLFIMAPRVALLHVDGWLDCIDFLVDFPKWPVARAHLAQRCSRLYRHELRVAFAAHVQRLQLYSDMPVLPPCTWCGQPTGGFCDFCTGNGKGAVCSACGGTDASSLAACRACAFIANVQIQRCDLQELVMDSYRIYSDDPRSSFLLPVSPLEFKCQCACGCLKPLRLLDAGDIEDQSCWECRVEGCVCACMGCESGRRQRERRLWQTARTTA